MTTRTHGLARRARLAAEQLEDRLTPAGAQFAVGADEGASGHVKVFSANGILRYSFIAFPGFNGGVRVAMGDVTGDGTDDIAVGAGFGAGNGHIKVYDGETGQLFASFFSFVGFLGGVDVAIGDVNGDTKGDLIVGSGPSAAHVKVFDLAGGQELMSFLPYGAGFTGGITVSAGDLDGDLDEEVVVGTATGASHVKAFGLSGGAAGELLSFTAYDNYAGGIDVDAADLRGADGKAEILTAPLARGGSELVKLFDATGALLDSFTPTFPGADRGVRLATGDADGDGDLDIIVAGGPGRGSKVKAFDGATFAEIEDIAAFPGFEGGVFVG